MKMHANQHRIQIPPCRPYEINAAQSWLSDMSAVGLHPEQDFIFAGLAFFERGERRRYRYRFDIAKPATMFDDGGVEEEQQIICAAAGWELVGIWGDFAIYRSPNDAADIPELHTDPALHAAAYKKVRRRALGSLIWIVILAIVWVRMMFGADALLDAVLGVGLYSRFLSAVMILWALYLGVEHVVSLHTFCRRLLRAARGEPVSPSEQEEVRTERNWHSRAWHRQLSFIASFLLIGAWLLSGFATFLQAADEKNTVDLPGNEDRLPFALMQDFYDDDSTFIYSGLDWTNEIRQRKDICIPVHLQVLQNGTIAYPDGTSCSGGLTVRYIETVSEKLTALLVRQYRYSDEHDKHFGGYRALSPEILDSIAAVSDDLEVYTYTARFPTVLLRWGKRLLYINYYGEAYSSPDAVVRAMLSALADTQS